MTKFTIPGIIIVCQMLRLQWRKIEGVSVGIVRESTFAGHRKIILPTFRTWTHEIGFLGQIGRT